MTKPISVEQKVFNKVVRHLRKQGKRAYEGYCKYRTGNGLECGIGCLIPNKLYKKKMEGKSVASLLDMFPKVTSHFERLYPGVDIDFYRSIQRLHDDWRDSPDGTPAINSLNSKVKTFADEHGLKVPK